MNPYLLFVILILVGGTLFDLTVEFLNQSRLRPEIPAELEGFVEAPKYLQSIEYQRESFRFGTLKRLITLAVFLAFMLAGGFNEVDVRVRAVSAAHGWGSIRTGLLFVGALLLLRSVLQLPFSLYDTFVIEAKYGFNRTTFKTWLGDLIRGTLLGVALGAPAFAGLLWFFERTGALAWVYSWLAVTGLQLLLLFAAPAFILPLFNKFTPLPDGELTAAVRQYSERAHFKLQGVFTMDSSKRSTKSNAFFTGFGRFRRLVLFDTLIEKHTTEELVAIFAHEVGHFKLKHIPKAIALSIFSSGLLFFVLSRLIDNPGIFAAFRMENLSIYASFIFVSFFYAPLARVISIASHLRSRRAEFEADRYSTETYGKPAVLANALKRLSVDNMSHLTPHPLKVFLDYTHPPVLERVKVLQQFAAAGGPS